MRSCTACGLLLVLVSSCIEADDSYTEGPDIGESAHASYTATRHPIVLVHGLLGFDEMFGAIAYFHGVPEALADGGAQVFVVTASQAERPEVRGAQIIPQLEAIAAETGAERFNLIGHSQGALDARFIAATRPDLVASVTSIGGPHLGSPVADVALGPLPVMGLQGIADMIMLVSGSTDPNDAEAALRALSTAGAAAFNVQYPAAMPSDCGEGAAEVGGIRYYSWGGVGKLTNPLDLGDPMLVAASLLIPGPSDGLVGRCSTHLGDVIRDDYPHNHLDQTNLILGLVGLFGPSPVSLYRQHANRLKLAGL